MDKLPVVLVGAIVLIVIGAVFLIPKGISSSNSSVDDVVVKNITFNSSGLSFDYPESYKNFDPEEITSPDASWSYILNVYDNSTKLSISVQKNNEGPLPAYVKIADKNSIKSFSGEVLSDTKTTINGIEIEKMIFKVKSPNTEEYTKYISYVFKSKNDITYSIVFQGPPDNFNSTEKLANDVMNTVKTY